MADNEELDPTSPQNISNVFAAEEFLSRSSSDSDQYKLACILVKLIRSSILSAGVCPNACNRALSIALNRKCFSPIMAVTGAIFPKQYANAVTLHEQNKNKLSHATSIGNKIK